MSDQDLSIDLDVAAKTRASILEEGEAGFDMKEYYKTNCKTTACLAGHMCLANGHEVVQLTDVPNSDYRFGDLEDGWRTTAFRELFNLSKEEVEDVYKFRTFQQLAHIFMKTDSSRATIISAFDKFVEQQTTEEEYHLYHKKSQGYQSYYSKLRNKNNDPQ